MNKTDVTESDFVCETPPKTIAKRIKRKIKVKPLCVIEGYKLQRNETFFSTVEQTCRNLHMFCKLPYVYYEIRKIVDFTVERFPKNNKLHTLGKYNQEDYYRKYLVESVKLGFRQPVIKLMLNMGSVSVLPTSGTVIELFGYTEMKKKSLHYVPVFNVNFWKQVTGNVDWYMENLKKRDYFVPDEYKALESIAVDVSCTQADDCFNETDESYFYKHVRQIEDLLDEITQLMNIDLELFL